MDCKMKVFADDQSVVGLPFLEYMKLVADKKQLVLPPIQRGFVWRPAQIAYLWDSLLRGMPIGTMLVNRLKSGNPATNLAETNSRRILGLQQDCLALLDGQQRTLSMALGLPSSPMQDYCIWIDLFENGKYGAPFELRISSCTQPFGFTRQDHERPSTADRWEALLWRLFSGDSSELSRVEREAGAPLSEARILKVKGLRLTDVRPWKGLSAHRSGEDRFLVPLQKLWEVFLEANSRDKKTSAIIEMISARADEDVLGTDAVKGRLDALWTALDSVRRMQVPLVLVPDLHWDEDSNDPGEHPMIILFERLANGGSRLTPGELLYSMIKQVWPEAQNLVSTLHTNPKVRCLMSEIDFVLTAFRFAMLDASDMSQLDRITDYADPTPRDFHRNLDKVLGTDAKPGPLRGYLASNSVLVHAFEHFYDLIAYQPDRAASGVPHLMMPHLRRPLIQVVVYWVMRQLLAKSPNVEASRDQIIGFTLFWDLCHIKDLEASKESMRVLLRNQQPFRFPGTELYAVLTRFMEGERDVLMYPVVSPEEAMNALTEEANAALKITADRDTRLGYFSRLRFFGEHFQEGLRDSLLRELLERFWWETHRLLWLQRYFIANTFGTDDFACTTERASVPYDYDHLCPRAEWSDLRHFRDSPNLSSECRESLKDRERRKHTGDSIGNFHILTISQNRSLGAASCAQKLMSLDGCGWTPEDGAIPISDVSLWKEASPSPTESPDNIGCCSSDERVANFQEAVVRRFLHLYAAYHEAIRPIVDPSLVAG